MYSRIRFQFRPSTRYLRYLLTFLLERNTHIQISSIQNALLTRKNSLFFVMHHRSTFCDQLFPPVPLVVVDEAGRRAVVTLDIFRLAKLCEDVLREDLPKLNTHLVVGVDTQNDALREYLVLVQGNQGSQRLRGKEWEDDAVTGPITLEDFALDQRLGRVGTDFLADLFLSLTEGERLGLCKEIGE